MNNEFVTYEQALALKELGFDEECLAYYHTTLSSSDVDLVLRKTQNKFYHLIRMPEHFDILTPLKQQVFRWFREEYELITSIRHNKFPDMSGKQYYFEYEYKNSYERYITYEEAENACIDKLIEIAKQK